MKKKKYSFKGIKDKVGNWLFCVLNGKRKAHKPEKMMFVYIIPYKSKILSYIIDHYCHLPKKKGINCLS